MKRPMKWAAAILICLAGTNAMAKDIAIEPNPAKKAVLLDVPSNLQMGNIGFERVGCAMRQLMWKEIYVLSLYSSPSAARLLRMDVVYDGDMPDGMPDDWRPKLMKVVSKETIDNFDKVFSSLERGDSVEFAYLPEASESTVRVNGQTELQVTGLGLYDTLQAMWLGDEPISKSIKRDILNNVCEVATLAKIES